MLLFFLVSFLSIDVSGMPYLLLRCHVKFYLSWSRLRSFFMVFRLLKWKTKKVLESGSVGLATFQVAWLLNVISLLLVLVPFFVTSLFFVLQSLCLTMFTCTIIMYELKSWLYAYHVGKPYCKYTHQVQKLGFCCSHTYMLRR